MGMFLCNKNNRSRCSWTLFTTVQRHVLACQSLTDHGRGRRVSVCQQAQPKRSDGLPWFQTAYSFIFFTLIPSHRELRPIPACTWKKLMKHLGQVAGPSWSHWPFSLVASETDFMVLCKSWSWTCSLSKLDVDVAKGFTAGNIIYSEVTPKLSIYTVQPWLLIQKMSVSSF